ncbi:hypothetical protein BGZ93_007311 [Podila epicladia]|nr:hypothetical protein BGZ92_010106 [Podila epicladia]KAG0094364.1 hypothetical protein BGZ93_007311 [Podila epicladia]
MTGMESSDARFYSFTQKTKSWPHPETFKATPSTLSEAGFFWKPSRKSSDNVVCFLCHKSIDGWIAEADPFQEHLDHSRKCGWAIVKSIPYVEKGGLPFTWDDEPELPKGKRMTDARFQTFGKWWPHEHEKGWFGTSKRMANAGFIFAPTDDNPDNCQCPYCNIALDGWEAWDDPVHEHQRRTPACPFFATRLEAPTKASSAKSRKRVEIKEQNILTSPRAQRTFTVENTDNRITVTSRRVSKAATPTPQPPQPPLSVIENQAKSTRSSWSSTSSRASRTTNVSVVIKQKRKLNQATSHISEIDSHKDTTEESPSVQPHVDEEFNTPPVRKPRSTTKRVRIASRILTSDNEELDHAIKAEEEEPRKPAEKITRAATLPQEPEAQPEEEALDDENESAMEQDHPPEVSEASKIPEPPEAPEEIEEPEEDDQSLMESLEHNQVGTENMREDMAGHTPKQEIDDSPEKHIEFVPMDEDDKPVEPESELIADNEDHSGQKASSAKPVPVAHESKTPVRDSIAKAKPAFIPDVEEPGGVPMDPATPVRTAASRLDADDWEDDDRRESGQSQMTSPFLSPSQWVDLTSSTPKSRKTPIQLGHTPRQRFKDMVGTSPAARSPIRRGMPQFPQLVSPAMKRKVKPSMSPEAKQNRLIDRLENLMHDNANMEVLAVAEQAVKEEAKLLKRSQTKERKVASKDQGMGTESAGAPGSPEHTNIFRQGASVMKTPTRKPSSMHHESPETPIRTPLPISKVISAIGAASRRANTTASPVPFVRTPVRKGTQILRLEDLEVDHTSSTKSIVVSDSQDKSDSAKVRDGFSKTFSGEDKKSYGSQSSMSHPSTSATTTAPKSLNYNKDVRDSEDTKDGVISERARIMKEANITEEELQMTVEDFHRAFVAREIMELELAAESWVLKFEEESNRVRMALLEGSDL